MLFLSGCVCLYCSLRYFYFIFGGVIKIFNNAKISWLWNIYPQKFFSWVSYLAHQQMANANSEYYAITVSFYAYHSLYILYPRGYKIYANFRLWNSRLKGCIYHDLFSSSIRHFSEANFYQSLNAPRVINGFTFHRTQYSEILNNANSPG